MPIQGDMYKMPKCRHKMKDDVMPIQGACKDADNAEMPLYLYKTTRASENKRKYPYPYTRCLKQSL